MKIRFPWRKKSDNNQMEKIEGLLTATLQTVSPRSEFISDLRQGLVGDAERLIFGRISPKSLKIGFLGIGAALGGIVLVIAGLRWVVSLLAAIGILQLSRNKKGIPQSIPVKPAH